jgi:hypothetical protein
MPISDETRKKWKEKIESIIEADNYGCITLTAWEQGFVDSVFLVLDSGKDLSMKQSSALSRIYEKIC